MRGYVWKAVDPQGRVSRGSWELPNESAVRSRLLRENRYPLSIRRRRASLSLSRFADNGLLWSSFMRKLSVLLASGITLLAALQILTRESTPAFRRISGRLAEQVRVGTDFSLAVASVDPPPPAFSLAMVEAGERSGLLAEALGQLAEALEKEQTFLRHIRSILAYPFFLFCSLMGVIYGLGFWVLPRYESLFQNLGTDLPWLSRLLLAVSSQLPLGILVFLGLGISLSLAFKFRYQQNWRLEMREKVSCLPGLGSLLRWRELAYFSRMMNMLLEAGVSMDEALQVGLSASTSRGMRTFLQQLLMGIRQGNRLAPLLKAGNLFPQMAVDMLSIGEESGRWAEMFGHVAKDLQSELEERLQNLSRLAEPIMILVLALFVGIVAGGVLLPVFEISGQMQ